MINATVVLEISVIGAAVLNLAANGLALYRRLRVQKGVGDLWKAGYHVGIGYAIERFQRVPSDLLSSGPNHHVHDVEVMVRRAAEELRGRAPGE